MTVMSPMKASKVTYRCGVDVLDCLERNWWIWQTSLHCFAFHYIMSTNFHVWIALQLNNEFCLANTFRCSLPKPVEFVEQSTRKNKEKHIYMYTSFFCRTPWVRGLFQCYEKKIRAEITIWNECQVTWTWFSLIHSCGAWRESLMDARESTIKSA